MNTETTLITVPVELAKAVAETGLTSEAAQSVCRSFAPHYVSATALLEEAKGIAVNAPIAAKAMRLRLKAVRCAAEATRKMLNEDAQVKTRSINAINALIFTRIDAEETRLDIIEKAELILAAQKKAALKLAREQAFAPYGVASFDLSMLSDADWQQHLENAKAGHEARIAAAKAAEAAEAARVAAAEAERVAREKKLAAEREAMRIENERLAKLAAEERAARAAAEKIAAAKLAKAQAAAKKEREAAAELQRQANEKHAAEHAAFVAKQKAERELQEAVARKEKEAADAKRRELEADAKKQRDALAAIEAEQVRQRAIESQRIAAEREAARKAAAAPDREKLLAFVQAIRDMVLPEMATQEGENLLCEARSELNDVAERLEANAKDL